MLENIVIVSFNLSKNILGLLCFPNVNTPGITQDCCSNEHPCGEGGGECAIDAHCKPGLICGRSNCVGSLHWPPNSDCCTARRKYYYISCKLSIEN